MKNLDTAFQARATAVEPVPVSPLRDGIASAETAPVANAEGWPDDFVERLAKWIYGPDYSQTNQR